MPTFRIDNHLIIPFGCPKWAIQKIRVSGVSTTATYFASESPIAYIDRSANKPLRLSSIQGLLAEQLATENSTEAAFHAMRDHLKSFAEIGTDFERRFLDLYFAAIEGRVDLFRDKRFAGEYGKTPPYNDPNWRFGALVPLPQAHLYMEDPLSDTYSFEPQRMVRVDFAFWTGTQLVAVEVDGSSHVGDREHVTRDRMLQRAGVRVIHILNEELIEHGKKAVERLLPNGVLNFWRLEEKYSPSNPLCDDMPF